MPHPSPIRCLIFITTLCLTACHGQTTEKPHTTNRTESLLEKRTQRLLNQTSRIDPALADRRILVGPSDSPESQTRHNNFLAIYDFFPVTAQTSFRTWRDDDALYLEITCQNPIEGPGKGDLLWVLLSPGEDDPRFAQIQISANGSIRTLPQPELPSRAYGVVRRFMNIGQRIQPKVEGKVTRNEHDWTALLKIPFNKTDLPTPGPDDIWRLNIIRSHTGRQPISTWSPLLNGYQRVGDAPYWDMTGNFAHARNSYGELVFASQQSPLITSDITLDYLDSTHKRIQLPESSVHDDPSTWQWSWQDPNGKTTDLSPPRASPHQSSSWIIEHPFPAEHGRYRLSASSLTGQNILTLAINREAIIRAGAIHTRPKTPVPAQQKPQPVPALSEEAAKLLAMMPPSNGFWGVPSPAAKNTSQDRNPYNFSWSPDQPFQLTCVATGEVFPNDRYPIAGETAFPTHTGGQITIPYVLRKDGVRCYLTARLWRFQLDHIVERLPELAKEDPYGAARVLYELSLRYPDFMVILDQTWAPQSVTAHIGPPFRQMGGAMWERWPEHGELRLVLDLARTLKILERTPALVSLSAQTGDDVVKRIEYGMIRPSIEHMRSFPIQNHNIDGFGYEHLVEIAKVLNEPDYIHDVIERSHGVARDEFYVDGFFNEITISYHRQTLARSIDAPSNNLAKWSDPVQEASPRLGYRWDRNLLNEDIINAYPHLKNSYALASEITYPNGRALPIQDSWASDPLTPRTEAQPKLFPASKLIRLERSTPDGIDQAWLLANPKHTGHTHADPLSLAFFANGLELISIPGYDRSAIRSWSISTLAHNTVLINGLPFQISNLQEGGSVELFAPIDNNLLVARASLNDVVPNITSLYERELWLIGQPDGYSYLVDVFRVQGGQRHEYLLNAEALHSTRMDVDLPLEPYNTHLLPPGTSVREPLNQYDRGSAGSHDPAYQFIRNVSHAPLDAAYNLTMTTQEVLHQNQEYIETDKTIGGYHLSGFILGAPANDTLYLGEVPSLRHVRWSRESRNRLRNSDNYRDHYMPKLVLRREGDDLGSTFISVVTPFLPDSQGQAPVVDVMEQGNAVIVSIICETHVDQIISSREHTELSFGDIDFAGIAAFIRQDDQGNILRATLIGEGHLTIGDFNLHTPPTAAGNIIRTLRVAEGDEVDALVVDTPIDPRLTTKTIIVTHPDGEKQGLPLATIQPVPDSAETLLILEGDPGFKVTTGQPSGKTFFPFTQWPQGQHLFQLIPHLTFEQQ